VVDEFFKEERKKRKVEVERREKRERTKTLAARA